jgi:hypothetical protein
MLFNGLLAFGLRCLLQWENGRLDQKYGMLERQGLQAGLGGLERVQTEEGRLKEAGVGDENGGPRFRYIL